MNKNRSDFRVCQTTPARRLGFLWRGAGWGVCLLALLLIASCTRKSRSSGVKDLLAAAPELRKMQLKFSFVFIGSSGKKYPVYMSARVDVDESQQSAVWNSNVDSDAGLANAVSESKTLKPDRDVQLKRGVLTAGQGVADPSAVTLTSGNPESGRGMSLNIQKVTTQGVATWKATGLSYFGYDAQIEDSHLMPLDATPTSQSPAVK